MTPLDAIQPIPALNLQAMKLNQVLLPIDDDPASPLQLISRGNLLNPFYWPRRSRICAAALVVFRHLSNTPQQLFAKQSVPVSQLRAREVLYIGQQSLDHFCNN